MKQLDRLVTLRLPLDLLQRIEQQSRAAARSPSEMIRKALETGLCANSTDAARPLHVALGEMIADAGGWLTLQMRLRRAGYVLRLHEDDRLALHDWPGDHFVDWLDTLGFDYGALRLRYRAPFPGALPRKPPPCFKSHRVA